MSSSNLSKQNDKNMKINVADEQQPLVSVNVVATSGADLVASRTARRASVNSKKSVV